MSLVRVAVAPVPLRQATSTELDEARQRVREAQKIKGQITEIRDELGELKTQKNQFRERLVQLEKEIAQLEMESRGETDWVEDAFHLVTFGVARGDANKQSPELIAKMKELSELKGELALTNVRIDDQIRALNGLEPKLKDALEGLGEKAGHDPRVDQALARGDLGKARELLDEMWQQAKAAELAKVRPMAGRPVVEFR